MYPQKSDAMVEGRQVPETLGRYKIIQRLAIGGMAELFLARVSGIEGFEKYIVVKRILPQYAQDRHFVDMFLDEARLAARLDHQNIAQVHDIGQDEGAYFFAMEYLHGEDVQGILKAASDTGKWVPMEQALTIVHGVAAGLQYAHEKRDTDGLPLHIVHRDVAPSNVIVTYDGGVKLVDFGIARAHFRQSKTEAGRVKGKLSYMSPEQCRGEELDARSDIFSLGIVAYELTTMSRLFRVRRSNRLAVMERIVKGDIPLPSERVANFPPELERIILRALKVSRKRRYQSAGEFLQDLEGFAKRSRVSLSSTALARCLRELVGYRPEPWRIDRAHVPQDAGKIRRGEEQEQSLNAPAIGISKATTPSAEPRPISASGTIGHDVADSLETMAYSGPVGHMADQTASGGIEITAYQNRQKRQRNIAIVAAIGVFLLLLLISQLGQEANSQAPATGVTPAGQASAEDGKSGDDVELPLDDVTGTSAADAGRASATPTPADSRPEKTKSRRSRSKKRSDKKPKPAAKSQAARDDGEKAATRRSSSRKSKSDEKRRARADKESRKKSASGGEDKRKTNHRKPRKEPKKSKPTWNPDDPFPPSANR